MFLPKMTFVNWSAYVIIVISVGGEQKVVVVAGNECNVTNIAVSVNNSTFSINYDLTLNNPSACTEEVWRGIYVPCSYDNLALCRTCQSTSLSGRSGQVPVQNTGHYRLLIVDKKFSDCFSVTGQLLGNDIHAFIDYTTNGVSVTMKNDVRVSKTTIEAYRAKKTGLVSCGCDDPDPHFEKLETLQQSQEEDSKFSSKRSFNFDDCLCFLATLKGVANRSLHYCRWFSREGKCMMPVSEKPVAVPRSRWKIGLILAAMLAAIVITIIIAVTRRRWKMNRVNKVTPEKPPLSPVTEVLILYSLDVAISNHLQALKEHLAKCLKVSELDKYDDLTRLEDESAWVVRKVVEDSSVRVVVVESRALLSLLASILGGKSEEEDLDQGLLRFALRSIMATGTYNYSKVFVVRLNEETSQGKGEAPPGERKVLLMDEARNDVAIEMKSEDQKEVEGEYMTKTEGWDKWNLLVGNRRYQLPRHYTALMNDLGTGEV